MFIFFFSCNESKKEEIAIVWNNNQAVAISIPQRVLNSIDVDSVDKHVRVQIEGGRDVAMLGTYSFQNDKIIFKPLVPLTRGLGYDIILSHKLIGRVRVAVANAGDAAELVNIYPTNDTLPENLLKIYLQFSQPMREGESQKHIKLVNSNKDTMWGVFLDLQPELWNKERTVLTMWLDPGRIKRELIPNQKLGIPLQKGERYTLVISGQWRDVQGLPLRRHYTKSFMVGSRDSISPNPEKWTMNVPASGTNEPLEIVFNEPLDYFLLQETITVTDEKDASVEGKIRIAGEESKLQFIQQQKWITGRYRVKVESILEDLAGNNLNRPFDRDIRVKNFQADNRVFERSFEVRN